MRPAATPLPLEPGQAADPAATLPDGEKAEPKAADAREEPRALLERLDELAWECETGDWAMEVARLAGKALAGLVRGSPDTPLLLGQLDHLADQAETLAASLQDDPLASRVRRAEYALRRRLDVWKQAASLSGPDRPGDRHADPEPDPDRLLACLTKVEVATAHSAEGQAWREYLGLDLLRGLARPRGALDDQQRRALARAVLRRLHQNRMTDQQQEFARSEPLAALGAELRRWAAGTADPQLLVTRLERFEHTGLPSDARALARAYQQLVFSGTVGQEELGRRFETHYRNANVRFAVSADLLNRLVPKPEPEQGVVNDYVLGRPVFGQSLTSSQLRVRLIPDPERLRLALEVSGRVAAQTSSSAGPARFHNASDSTYTAWKEIELGASGIRFWPASVQVQNDIRLQSLNTNFDVIPLVGALVQSVARSQHEQSRQQASWEVSRKIETQAKQRIDSEAEARLGELARRLQERVLRPLDEMGLEPATISAQTTEERLVARLRLASPEQLGGHTPRPQAPADSLASVQVHESAINNVLEQLGLNGKTLTVAELRGRLAARFPGLGAADANTENDDAEITFAERDALRVRCEDGLIVLTVSIAELDQPPHYYCDFQVRVCYRPERHGLDAELAREGVVQLIGDRLNPRAQIVLRGIFSKTFSKNRSWRLTPDEIVADERLSGLAISQFVVEDGWMGMAIGPKRPGTEVAQRRAGERP